jgi:hypothetical protein
MFNNATLGIVKLEMLVDGLPNFGTDHAPVNFAAIAAGSTPRAWKTPTTAKTH